MENNKNLAIYNNGIISGINADCFIIPNRCGSVNDFLGESTRKEYRKQLAAYAALNNFEFDDDTPLIQVWLTAEENLNSENLYRHTNTCLDTEGNEYCVILDTPEFLPYTFVVGRKEGDVLDIKMPVAVFKKENRLGMLKGEMKADDAVAEIKLRLNQKSYRYRSFGTFEETLKQVL